MALMEQWQDAVSEQIKLLTDRLNEILSKGLDWLRVELQLDLGLKPELVPPWIILCAACTGLFLLVALWASVCRAVFKKRITVSSADDGIEGKPTTSKPTKPEDPKKKKRKEEKKAQPNGRTVLEPHDEELVPLNQQIQADTKTEKVAETKKSKKKVKQAVKETKIVTDDGREPEEGTWETKVSNKEKREQRKKDKSSSDGSASPGGGSTPVSPPPKQPKASAAPPAPVSQKKRKEESTKVKAEKLAAVVPPANSSGAAEVAASVANTTVKATPNAAAPDMSWTTQRQPAPIWRTGIDDSWTVIDRPITSPDLSLSSLAGLGVGTAEPLPVRDLPWLSQSRVDDVWSGLNGSSADPSSDWNAPSEAWGNYEEPTPEAVVAQELLPPKVNLTRAVEEDEDDKDKGDDGAVKTKKKKQKKKKKVAEEGGASGQVEERVMEKPAVVSVKKQQPAQEKTAMMQPVKAAAVESERGKQDTVISQKIPVTQVPQTPSDDLSAPTPQKKPEENQAAKPVKKKKVRRET